MNFVNDPVKVKQAFVATLIIAIVFSIGSGVLGYLYWQKNSQFKTADLDKKALTSQVAVLTKQISDLKNLTGKTEKTLAEENAILEKENETLKSENTSYKTKIAKANAYNNVFKYLNSVIETHNGFSGWTDAEFETGKAIAEKTNDASYVSTINWAWYEKTVDVTTRVLRVWKETQAGIETSLK